MRAHLFIRLVVSAAAAGALGCGAFDPPPPPPPPPPASPCTTHLDCCDEGPAFLCTQGECRFNSFMANDPNAIAKRQQECGGTTATDPDTDACYPDPNVEAKQQLQAGAVSRDTCQSPIGNEQAFCDSQDGQILSLPQSTAYTGLLERIRSAGGIGNSVPIRVTPDLQSSPMKFGGGVTGSSIVVVDGKFLDILAEYSCYLAYAELGLTTVPREQAIDQIVHAHNSVPGGPAAQSFFPFAGLPANGQLIAEQRWFELAGPITFHEFGHYWAWVCIDKLRDQATGGSFMYYYPMKFEDDADFFAGILSAKAQIPLMRAQEMIDLMAFYVLNRQHGVPSIINVEQSYQTQLQQQSANYRSLAGRKQVIADGYFWFGQ